MAEVPSQAGVPGAVSGRQRRQGRKPASAAAAAVGKYLMLRCLAVGAGQIGTYTFYYFFDTINQEPPTVPEPGTVTMLLTGVVGCGGMLAMSGVLISDATPERAWFASLGFVIVLIGVYGFSPDEHSVSRRQHS